MKKVLVIVLALCLVMGAAVAEATAHLDKLTLEFVPSKDADVIIAGTEGLPEMLQAALLEQGYEVDEIDITVAPATRPPVRRWPPAPSTSAGCRAAPTRSTATRWT